MPSPVLLGAGSTAHRKPTCARDHSAGAAAFVGTERARAARSQLLQPCPGAPALLRLCLSACSPPLQTHGKSETKANVCSCLFLVNGVKPCDFVALGVDEGPRGLAGQDVTREAGRRQQLPDLVDALGALVPQLLLGSKHTRQPDRDQDGTRTTLLPLLENIHFLHESFPCTFTKFKQVALQGFWVFLFVWRM